MKYRVVDVRNDEVIFESDDKQTCINYMDNLWEENSTDYIYSWLVEDNLPIH